jgi:hypothetical protein
MGEEGVSEVLSASLIGEHKGQYVCIARNFIQRSYLDLPTSKKYII